MNFYLTFGQKSPFRDGYVVIEAEDYAKAREAAFYVFGDNFAFLYEAKPFEEHSKNMFPEGQIGKTLFG